MIAQARKIFDLLDHDTRISFFWLFALMVLAALLEMAGVGLFLPLLQMLVVPDSLSRLPLLAGIYDTFSDFGQDRILIGFCLVMVAFFAFKAVVLGIIIFIQNRFVTHHQALFARRVLRHYLAQPYVFHLQHNSMELIRNVTLLSSRVFVKGLLPILQFTMEFFIIFGIFTVLLMVDPVSTLTIGFILGCAVGIFYLWMRLRIQEWGRRTVEHDGQMLLWVNQALNAIKETKLYNREDFFADAFAKPALERAKYLARSATAPHLSRLFIEAVAIGTMAVLVAVLVGYSDADAANLLPTLGLFAVAAMRLMPSLSKLVSAVTTFRENTAAVNVIHADLFENNQAPLTFPSETESSAPLSFNEHLQLNGLGYRYPGAVESSLSGISLEIERGQSVAVVGRSGSGKTTLIDLILGLLQPTQGRILADGYDVFANLPDWQQRIGYVPQEVYLTDDTLRRNIALGCVDVEINDDQIRRALTLAQLNDVVKDLPDGLETIVGERGTRLSGGQRQRIGIARALYDDPEILIMDEATSALDSETEIEIARAINQLSGDKTLIIIAHRLSTIRHCDRIVLLADGHIVDSGSFDELSSRSDEFNRMVDLAKLNPEQVT